MTMTVMEMMESARNRALAINVMRWSPSSSATQLRAILLRPTLYASAHSGHPRQLLSFYDRRYRSGVTRSDANGRCIVGSGTSWGDGPHTRPNTCSVM
jgi:hypothetical protein